MSLAKAWRGALALLVLLWGSAAAHAQDSVTIPLAPNPQGNGIDNFITVSVGGGPASEVLLDTGSTGLRFLASQIGPDVTVTNIPVTYGYSSGNYLTGYLGYAPVAFPDAGAPLSTPGPIAIQVVESVTCKADTPDCPGWEATQSGVMGVAYDNEQIFNPLAQLAGNLGSGFIIVDNDLTNPSLSPEVVVGLTPSNMQGFVFAPLGTTTGGSQPAGLNVWNTKGIYTCFAVNSGSQGCFDSVFDTGASLGSFVTPDSPQFGPVAAGSTVTMTVPDAISLSTVAGDEPWTNQYVYEPAHGGTPGYNTGALVYRYYAVLFDAWTGQIGFSPIVNWIFGSYAPANDAALGAPGSAIALGGTLVMPDGFASDRPVYLIADATLQSQGMATLGGTLSGSDPLTIKGPGTLDLTGSSLFSGPILVRSGTLLVNGVLPATILLADGATLGGDGMVASFAAAAGSTLSPGNSIGALDVVGSVAFGPGSVYRAELGAPGISDLIAAGGEALLAGTVEPVPGAGFQPKLDAGYTILTAGGGVIGDFKLDDSALGSFGDLQASYPFLSPILTTSSDAVLLVMTRSGVSFAAAGATSNETAVGGAADGLSLTDPIVGALAALDRAGAAKAFDSLSGEVYASTQSLLQQQSSYLRAATNGRLIQAFADPLSPADSAASKLSAAPLPSSDQAGGLSPTVWAEGYGGWDHLGGDANAAALDASGGGFLMGIDNPIGPAWRLGIAGGYGSSSFDVAGRASSGSIDSYDIAVYGGARYGDLGIRLGAGYGWNDIRASRSVAFPAFSDQLGASYSAGTAQVYGEVGYDLHLGGTTVEPLADLAYVNLATDGFSESGGPAALTAGSASFDTTYSVLGARISHGFGLGNGSALTATARVGWQHAFGDVTPSTALAFAGASTPFAVSGAPINQNSAIVELGLGYSPAPNVTFGLYYSGQLGAEAQENSLSGTVNLKF
jgi:outer membrane autotransporter protein